MEYLCQIQPFAKKQSTKIDCCCIKNKSFGSPVTVIITYVVCVCRARILLLKSYGILQLDRTEAEDVRLLRESREKCGCSCLGQNHHHTLL